MESFVAASGDALRFLLPPAVIFGVFALVMKRQAVVQMVRRAKRETLTNLGLVAVNLVLLAPFFAMPKSWIEATVTPIATLEQFWASQPEFVTLLATLLLADLVIYWRHRIEHTPALWPIHATHHSDETITWLTLVRKHPLGQLVSTIVDATPLLVIGVPVWAILLTKFIHVWWGFFIHADTKWTLGKLDWIMMSPAAHRVHHIRDRQLANSNYAGFVSIWDRLFGTWQDPRPHLGCDTGIDGGSRDVLGELVRPVDFYAKMARGEAIEGEAVTAETAKA